MSTKTKSAVAWEVKPRITEDHKKSFSADEVIDAYFKGKKDQKDEDNKILMEKFGKNLEKAQEVIEKFFLELVSKGIQCKFLRLRASKITEFDSIIVVEESDFASDKFEDIYNESINLASDVNSDTFRINFSFMPYSEHIKTEKLIADGYLMTYGKTK